MALLDEILAWTENLPMWQRDAARRLFQKNSILSQNDYKELYLLLKDAHGLPVPLGISPEPLNASHLPRMKPGEKVILKTVRDLKYVNRIASEQKLNLLPDGMTVVYGGNGSGKSGYARVLKHACRTRGELDPIYPDANNPNVINCIPEAVFDIEINKETLPIKWTRSTASPDELATVSIFDSQCARTYLTDKQDIAYMPYGLDIVENLATQVINNLTVLLRDEINNIDINTNAFSHLLDETAVGQAIKGLNEKTLINELQRLGTLSDSEMRRLIELNKVLAEPDPVAKANMLKLSASRMKELLVRIDKVLAWVTDKAIDKLKKIDADVVNSDKAEKEAANLLQSGETLLHGTGEKTWKMLFEAARKFSTEEAYPEHSFPNLDENAVCPLCQQPINAVVDRLKRFDEYIQNDIAKTAAVCRENLFKIKAKIENVDLDIGIDAALDDEIKSFDPETNMVINAFKESIEMRRTWMLQAIVSHLWTDVPIIAENPQSRLCSIIAKQLCVARRFFKVANAENKKALQHEHAELTARQNLSKCLTPVIKLVERMKRRHMLRSCENELKTRPISDKSKDLAKKFLTKELFDALITEFTELGIDYIKPKLKEQAGNGKYTYQLLLDIPVSRPPEKILSEGEQRAIALGAFLAEMTIAKHDGAIVFDDPVSSLDHKYREKVSKRLVDEAKKRQVIIFTHDIYFLCLLSEEAGKAGVKLMTQSLYRNSSGFGNVSLDIPFEAKKTSSRVGSLNDMWQKIDKAYRDGDERVHHDLTIKVYSQLRITWERAIEEVLFRSVVTRFKKSIETQKLSEVTVEDNDYKIICHNMTKCSNFIAHDSASLGTPTIPSPDDLKVDIDALELWRGEIEKRSQVTRERRKK